MPTNQRGISLSHVEWGDTLIMDKKKKIPLIKINVREVMRLFIILNKWKVNILITVPIIKRKEVKVSEDLGLQVPKTWAF